MHAVDIVMVCAKRIYILIIKVNKLFSFYLSRCFLKQIENMYSVFLSSYRNTRESLGELKKLWKHSPAAHVLRNRKHVPCLYRVIETGVEVWENEKCCGNTSRRLVFPQHFSFS